MFRLRVYGGLKINQISVQMRIVAYTVVISTEGVDYVGVHKELSVSTDVCAQVIILDNSILERDKTFLVTLASNDTAVEIARSETLLTILDDDRKKPSMLLQLDIYFYFFRCECVSCGSE